MLWATDRRRRCLDYYNNFVLTASGLVPPFTRLTEWPFHISFIIMLLFSMWLQCLQDEAQTPWCGLSWSELWLWRVNYITKCERSRPFIQTQQENLRSSSLGFPKLPSSLMNITESQGPSRPTGSVTQGRAQESVFNNWRSPRVFFSSGGLGKQWESPPPFTTDEDKPYSRMEGPKSRRAVNETQTSWLCHRSVHARA